MKVSVDDFMRSHRKTALDKNLEKVLATAASAAREPTKEEVEKGAVVKTFVLSPTGGEIHRGESVVDRVSKPETLREKIARFDRLAQRVKENRMYQMQILQESFGDGKDDAEDDFDFESGEIRDDFGDVVEIPSQPVDKSVQSGDGDGEQAAATKSQAAEKPSDEPDEPAAE